MGKMRSLAATKVLTALLLAAGAGQTAYYKGVVSDSGTSIKLDSVLVEQKGTANQVFTDSWGQFTITPVSVGDVHLLTSRSPVLYYDAGSRCVKWEGSQALAVRLYNLSGTEVAASINASRHGSLIVPQTPDGVYMLQARAQGIVFMKKMVVTGRTADLADRLASTVAKAAAAADTLVFSRAGYTTRELAVADGDTDLAVELVLHTVTHGFQLTRDLVGPESIGITTFTDVAGGYCTGTTYWGQPQGVPSEWVTKGLVRTVGPGGETIDGYFFPEGTNVVEGANITSGVNVYGNATDYGTGAVGVVFRGCRFRFAGYANIWVRGNHGMHVMVSYCDLGAKDTTAAEVQSDAFRGSGEPGKPFIMKRNYVSWTTNTAEIGSYLVIEENLSENFWAQPGDHTDGWQWGGGERQDVIVRNKVRLNDTHGITGCYSFFNDFAGGSGDYGYYDFIWDDNYIAGGGYSVYLPSAGRPTSNFKARGNRWSTEFHPNCGVYNAVYPTNPMSPTANGNEWLNNRWLDGPRAGQTVPVPGY